MPIYRLTDELIFPPVEEAEEGIVAVGGDLSPDRLLLAYCSGIFPWYSEGDPIIWWSPDPRFVLFPDELIISKSMQKVMRQKRFEITFDRCFREVMQNCGMPRKKQRGTWITIEMLEAYCRLHEMGLAHSAEAWKDGELAGGLYGVSIGRIFFGESMFSKADNASKAALIVLTEKLKEREFLVIDSQVYTDHLASLGAKNIPRKEYLALLEKAIRQETLNGNWGNF